MQDFQGSFPDSTLHCHSLPGLSVTRCLSVYRESSWKGLRLSPTKLPIRCFWGNVLACRLSEGPPRGPASAPVATPMPAGSSHKKKPPSLWGTPACLQLVNLDVVLAFFFLSLNILNIEAGGWRLFPAGTAWSCREESQPVRTKTHQSGTTGTWCVL